MPPTQIVSHFPPSDYLQTTHANCLLPEPETEHARMADGTVLVGVGKMGFSNERFYSFVRVMYTDRRVLS